MTRGTVMVMNARTSVWLAALVSAWVLGAWTSRCRAPTSTSFLSAPVPAPPLSTEVFSCTRIHSTASSSAATHFALGEMNYQPGSERFNEILRALEMSASSNPTMHFVLATSNLTLGPELVKAIKVPLDLWYCPMVLYGTLFEIGNEYQGVKIASSIDNWFRTMNFTCTFGEAGHKVAYALARTDVNNLSGQDMECEEYVLNWSWDGIMFDSIPQAAVREMKFPRNFWGCENLAGFIISQFGTKLLQLCPYYSPVHVHVHGRPDFRVRVNHPENSLGLLSSDDVPNYCSFH